MSFTVKVDASALKRWNAEIQERFGNFGAVLMEFGQDLLVPKLQQEAASRRQVRTGKYSGDWALEQSGNKSIQIMTDAYYWKFLEYGTKDRGQRQHTRLFKDVVSNPQRGVLKLKTTTKVTTRGSGQGISAEPVVNEVLEEVLPQIGTYLSQMFEEVGNG